MKEPAEEGGEDGGAELGHQKPRRHAGAEDTDSKPPRRGANASTLALGS